MPKGADILAEKLFHLIMNDYHNYKPKTETENEIIRKSFFFDWSAFFQQFFV